MFIHLNRSVKSSLIWHNKSQSSTGVNRKSGSANAHQRLFVGGCPSYNDDITLTQTAGIWRPVARAKRLMELGGGGWRGKLLTKHCHCHKEHLYVFHQGIENMMAIVLIVVIIIIIIIIIMLYPLQNQQTV